MSDVMNNHVSVRLTLTGPVGTGSLVQPHHTRLTAIKAIVTETRERGTGGVNKGGRGGETRKRAIREGGREREQPLILVIDLAK